MKKLWISVLCLLLLVSMVACKKDDVTPPDGGSTPPVTTAEPGGDQTSPAVALKLVENGQTAYRITYPEGAAQEVIDMVNTLAQKFQEYTGVAIAVQSDAVAADAAVPEILIGATNRAQSASALATVKGINDYSIMVVDNSLAINAHNDTTLNKAIYYIINFYFAKLPAGSQTVSFSSDDNIIYEANYSFKNFTVLGNDAEQYTIVVAKDGGYAAERFAARLQLLIANRTGKILPLTTDDKSDSDCEILVGQTARTTAAVGEQEYLLVAKGNRLEILADSAYDYEYIYQALNLNLMRSIHQAKPDSGEIAKVDTKPLMDEDGIASAYQKKGAVRMMSFNIHGAAEGAPYLPRVEMLIDSIAELSPDIISLTELTPAMREAGNGALLTALTAYGYAEVDVTTEGGKKSESAIFYRTSCFEAPTVKGINVITNSKGVDKYASWAVLQDKTTGNKLTVLSLELTDIPGLAGNTDRAAEVKAYMTLAKKLQKENSCSVMLCGDLNSGAGVDAEAYSKLLQNRFEDVASLAEATDDGASSYLALPTYNTFTGAFERAESDKQTAAVDHIMYVGNGLTFHSFDILSDGYTGAISDHMALILDFEIGTYVPPVTTTVGEWTNRY